MPSATSPTPAEVPSTHPDIPTFPSAAVFTFLPEIFSLLSRVQKSQQARQQANGVSTSPLAAAPTTSPALTTTTSNEASQPLELKDLPAAIYPLKQKIQKAREAVSVGMVDVDRSIDEQEREIRELEARCTLLKSRLGELGVRAAGQSGHSMRKDSKLSG
jgi:hypothetical protein